MRVDTRSLAGAKKTGKKGPFWQQCAFEGPERADLVPTATHGFIWAHGWPGIGPLLDKMGPMRADGAQKGLFDPDS